MVSLVKITTLILLLLLAGMCYGQATFDPFGGLITYSDGSTVPLGPGGPDPQAATCSRAATTVTCTVTNGAAFAIGEPMAVTGTGTALDWSSTVCASNLAQSQCGGLLITNIVSNTLTLSSPTSGTITSHSGTIKPLRLYKATVGGRTGFFTPLDHWVFGQGIAQASAPVIAKYGSNACNTAKDEYIALNNLGNGAGQGFNAIDHASAGQFYDGGTCPSNNRNPFFPEEGVFSYFGDNLIQNTFTGVSQPGKDMNWAANANYSCQGIRRASLDTMDPRFETFIAGWIAGNFSDPAFFQSGFIKGLTFQDSGNAMGAPTNSGWMWNTVPTGRNDCHQAMLLLATSPVQGGSGNVLYGGTPNGPNAFPGSGYYLYPDSQVYLKSRNTLTSCDYTNTAKICSLLEFLKAKYVTIGALNTAWGTSYTTFGSSGTVVTSETFGTGNGSQTSFTHSFTSGHIDPNSIQVYDNGTQIGFDCPTGQTSCPVSSGHGTFKGTNISGGTVLYSTGASATLTFSVAPANTHVISISYVHDGWGSTFGTGLMDEDGAHEGTNGVAPIALPAFANSHVYALNDKISVSGSWQVVTTAGTSASSGTPSWSSTAGVTSSSGSAVFTSEGAPVQGTGGSYTGTLPNANMGADLEAYTAYVGASALSPLKTAINTVAPDLLNWCVDQLGVAFNPPANGILQAANVYCDVAMTSLGNSTIDALGSAKYTEYTKYFTGPISNYQAFVSDQGAFTANGNTPDFSTRQLMGQGWYTLTNYWLNQVGFNGTMQGANLQWTSNVDGLQSTNFGIETAATNPYNTHDNVTASVSCLFNAFTCGGEASASWNGTDSITHANCGSCIADATKLWTAPPSSGTINHIIIIPMENRSMDEFFRDFPGVTSVCSGGSNAGTACIAPNDATAQCTGGGTCPYITTGQASTGTVTLQLQSASELFPVDLPHAHEASVWSIDGGLMDKFDNAPLNAGSLQLCTNGPYVGQCCGGNCTNSLPGGSCSPGSCGASVPAPYTYMDATQIPYLRLLATTYGVGDHMFATNSGPSNPSHFWMWAAQSFEMANNNLSSLQYGGGLWSSHWTCDALHTGQCIGGTNAGASCLTNTPCTGGGTCNNNTPSGGSLLYTGTEINERLLDGTFYFAGTCNNGLTSACTCSCATGTSCFQNEVTGYTTGSAGTCQVGGAACHVDNDCSAGATGPCVLSSPSWVQCSATAQCGAGNVCDTHHSISNTAGAPCPTVTTIADQMDAAGVSWRYYTNPNGLWNPMTYVRTNRYGPDFTNNVFNDECGQAGEPACTPSSGSLGDFALDAAACTSLSCNIGSVTWLSPGTISNSQHPYISTVAQGEAWMRRQIGAVMANSFLWSHTAIIITYDDWGGFYDHMAPPTASWSPGTNIAGNGIRVPLVVVSPYAVNAVNHTTYDFLSMLKSIENHFGVSSINANDAAATDMLFGAGGMLNLSQSPIPALPAATNPSALTGGAKLKGGAQLTNLFSTPAYNPHFPNATNSTLSQNAFAGCASGIPGALCGTNSTTYSVSSGVVTVNVANTVGPITGGNVVPLGVSNCSSATFLNGNILLANSSTTNSSVVGTLVNTQNTVLTPGNVGSTADTTCYLQGQGWQPLVLAPFPAPDGSNTSCVNGNGSPGCTASTTSSPSVINEWSYDWSIPGQNSYLPTVPIVQITDLTLTGGPSWVPSVSGETNDPMISWDDLSGGYFFGLVKSQGLRFGHGHIDNSHCGGVPCFMADTVTGSNYLLLGAGAIDGSFSRNQSNRPGTNQAIFYGIDTSNAYAPTMNQYTLTYTPGTHTVTQTTTKLYDIDQCPGWGYVTIGTNIAHTTQFRVDNFDNIFEFGLGSGNQGALSRHTQFAISLTSSPPTCATFDSAGMVGPNPASPASNLYESDPTASHQGSSYAANDTVSFSQAGSVCNSTFTLFAANIGTGGKVVGPLFSVNTTLSANVTTIGTPVNFTVASATGMYVGQTILVGTSGGSTSDNVLITNISGTTITGIFGNTHTSGTAVTSTMLNNSGCSLQSGVTTTTSGSGTGLEVDVDGVGTPSFETTYAGISEASCPINTTTTCQTAVQPCIAAYTPTTSPCTGAQGQQGVPYGFHSGNMEQSGTTIYASGHTPGTYQCPTCSDRVMWNPHTGVLYGGTQSTFTGHPFLGYGWQGQWSPPNFYDIQLPNGFSCPSLGIPTCNIPFSYAPACNSNPGGSVNHGAWPAPANNLVNPWVTTSSCNLCNFGMTSPPNWTCGLMASGFAINQNGTTSWFTHWYDNFNNTQENFEGVNAIFTMSPDEKFLLVPTDMYDSPGANLNGGNTGIGTSTDTPCSPTCQPFIGIFSVTLGLATQ